MHESPWSAFQRFLAANLIGLGLDLKNVRLELLCCKTGSTRARAKQAGGGGILESNARGKISYEHVFYMIIPLLSGGEEWKGMLA